MNTHIPRVYRFKAAIVAVFVLIATVASSVAIPALAGSSVINKIKVKTLLLVGSEASIKAKGTRPVKIDDDLRVTGNITVEEGSTVDGVDVSTLNTTVSEWTDTNTQYTAGDGIDITGTIVSADLSLSDNETITGNWVNTTHPWADDEVVDALTISGGTINNSPVNNSTIGATSAATGNFTNITLNGTSPILPALSSVPVALTKTTLDATTSNIGNGVSATVGIDGMPVISYVDVTNRDLRVAHCDNVECTSATITTVSDDARLYTTIIIGTDGYPVIAYDRMSSNGLMLLKCGNSLCSSGNTETLIEAVTPSIPSMTIGTDGFPIIAYVSSSLSDLKVAKCGNAACSSGNTLTTIDSDSVSTYPVSIAMAPDGFPVISYYFNTDTELKVAKCTAADCSTSGIQILDTTNNVGRYSSIAIGEDGLPFVAYFDETDANLKVAKCGNVNCTNAAAIITTIDSTGTVGRGPSVTLAPDGLPLVAYTDETNGYIKMLKCGNTGCSSNNVLTSAVNLNNTSFSFVHMVSLTLGRNNLPFIAYYDQAGLDLRVAALGSVYGKDNLVRR